MQKAGTKKTEIEGQTLQWLKTHFEERCTNCRHNPNGKKPYVKMMRISAKDFDRGFWKLIQNLADKTKLKAGCVLCKCTKEGLKHLFNEHDLRKLEANSSNS